MFLKYTFAFISKRILEQIVMCDDIRLQSLVKLAGKSHIELVGQCYRDGLSKAFPLKDLKNLSYTAIDDNPSKFDDSRLII